MATWRKCCNFIQKQIIGVLPGGNQQECFYFYAPDSNIEFWSVDGYSWDEVSDINLTLNPYGIYYNIFTTNNIAEPRFILTYVGTEPPIYFPSIVDNNANPVEWVYLNSCEIFCLEGTFNTGDYALFWSGYFVEAIQNPFTFDNILFSDFIKSLYGQQTTYFYNDNGDGTFYIKIDNAFVANFPLAWSTDNITYTDMVPCSPPASECLYVGFIQLNGGGSLSDYTLDDNITPLVTDPYGGGYLRGLMQSHQGDIYAIFNDSANFISNGIYLYYVGTSANNIDVNFLGSYFGTINFAPLNDNGIECRPMSCYTMTFPVAYNNLAIFQFSFPPLTTIAPEINSSAPIYNYIDVANDVDMTTLIKQIYGNSAGYNINDNGDGTYTMTITNAYYYGGNPQLLLLDSRFGSYSDTMTSC